MRPTRRFFYWMISLMILYLVSSLDRFLFTKPLLLLWVILPILAWMLGQLNLRQIECHLEERDEMTPRGTPGRFVYRISNRSAHRSIPVLLDGMDPEHRMQMKPKSAVDIEEMVDSTHCGYQYPSPSPWSTEDDFGFFRFFITKNRALPIYIVPKMKDQTPLSQSIINQTRTGMEERSQLRASLLKKDHISTLKEWEPGRSMRQVHWKQSARLQKWLLKRYDPEEGQRIDLIIALLEDPLSEEDRKTVMDDLLDETYTLILSLLEQEVSVAWKRWVHDDKNEHYTSKRDHPRIERDAATFAQEYPSTSRLKLEAAGGISHDPLMVVLQGVTRLELEILLGLSKDRRVTVWVRDPVEKEWVAKLENAGIHVMTRR